MLLLILQGGVNAPQALVDLPGRCLHADVARSVFPGEPATCLPRQTVGGKGGGAAIHWVKGLPEADDVGHLTGGDAKPLGGEEGLRQPRHSVPARQTAPVHDRLLEARCRLVDVLFGRRLVLL